MNFFIRFTTHFLALVIAVNCLGISYADSTKVDTVSPANINDICKLSIKAIQNPKNPSLVFFQIDLKNVNDRKLIFPLSRPLKDYRFTVKDEAGNSVPLTQYGISALKARLFSNRLDSLEPGMSSSVQFPFSWVFDLTKGGAFSITASRRVFPVYGEKSVEVDSDPVLLKIPVAPLSVSSVAQQTQINTSIDSVIPPATTWQVGDNWKVLVQIFTSPSQMDSSETVTTSSIASANFLEKNVNIIDTYTLKVEVESIENVDDAQYIKIIFTPSDNSPSYVNGSKFEVTLDAKSNHVIDAHVIDKILDTVLENIDNRMVMVHPVNGYAVGFPIDVIP